MPYRNGKIVLDDGVWVGACCLIGPNEHIKSDSVVVAASYVTNDLNANGIYRAIPLRILKNAGNEMLPSFSKAKFLKSGKQTTAIPLKREQLMDKSQLKRCWW